MPGAPKATLTGDAAQWVTDYDAMTFTNDCSAYRDLIQAYPYYAEAMDYANLDVSARTGTDGIWETIDATVGAGSVPAVTAPSGHPGGSGSTTLTAAETVKTYAAWVAHSLWLEVAEVVPWKMTAYNLNDLEKILHRDSIFQSAWGTTGMTAGWDGGATTSTMRFCVAHSPKEPYDSLTAAIGSWTTRQNAINDLIIYGDNTYYHGVQSDPRLVSEWETDGYTGGCPGASEILRVYCRSLNIAGFQLLGRWISGAHANVVMLHKTGEGRVLFHGDDMYITDGQVPYGTEVHQHRAELFSAYDPVAGENVVDLEQAKADTGNLSAYRQIRFPESAYSSLRGHLTYEEQKLAAQNGWCCQLADGKTRYGPPFLTYTEKDEILAGFQSAYAPDALLPTKRTASNTGYTTTLTPLAGPLTIDDAWVTANGDTLEDREVTGTVTVTALSAVTIRNCRIDGDGGVGVLWNTVGNNLLIFNCEITNCTTAIQGAPNYVFGCHIHGNTGTDILVDGQHAGALGDIVALGYNLIDAGSSNTAIHQSSGADGNLVVEGNTIVSTASVPLVLFNFDPAGEVRLGYNWIDGGSYCIYHDTTTSPNLDVYRNYFGRNATSGLYAKAQGGALDWHMNTYEDNGDTANSTDTAPL